MCDLTMALTAAGIGMQAFGAFNQAESQKEAARYQSQVAANNAKIAEWQATDSIRRGQEEEMRQRMRMAQMKGTQRARLAANGIDISEGSAAQVQADTDWMGEQDALTIRDNANREAWGYKNQSQQYKSDSAASRAVSKSISPWFSATSALLSNVGGIGNKATETNKKTSLLGETENPGQVANKWYNMRDGFNKTNELSIFNKHDDSWSTF